MLNEGPWAFDGSLLLVKKWTGEEGQVSEMEFNTTCFWISACDVLIV